MSEIDRQVLKSILEMKLSLAALREMKNNTSTNKTEAVNRAMTASLPKNVTYSRNALPRAASAVHRLNNKLTKYVLSKLNCVGSPLQTGSKAVTALKQMEKECHYTKDYKYKKQVRTRLLLARKRQAKEHFDYKNSSNSDKVESDYKKGQLEPKLCMTQSKSSDVN